jgi:hypothetical protein
MVWTHTAVRILALASLAVVPGVQSRTDRVRGEAGAVDAHLVNPYLPSSLRERCPMFSAGRLSFRDEIISNFAVQL